MVVLRLEGKLILINNHKEVLERRKQESEKTGIPESHYEITDAVSCGACGCKWPDDMSALCCPCHDDN